MEVLANGMKAQFWIPVEEEPDIDRFVDEQIMIDMERFMLIGTLEKVSTCKKKNEEKEWEYFKQITVQVNYISLASNNNFNIAIPGKKDCFLYEVKFRYAPEPQQDGEGMKPTDHIEEAGRAAEAAEKDALAGDHETPSLDELRKAAEEDVADQKKLDEYKADRDVSEEHNKMTADNLEKIEADKAKFAELRAAKLEDADNVDEENVDEGLTGAEAAELPPETEPEFIDAEGKTIGKPLTEVLELEPGEIPKILDDGTTGEDDEYFADFDEPAAIESDIEQTPAEEAELDDDLYGFEDEPGDAMHDPENPEPEKEFDGITNEDFHPQDGHEDESIDWGEE
jgi:hypothetical protein